MKIQETISRIYKEIQPLTAYGKVADYIPALAAIDTNQLGLSVHTIHGEHYWVGDAYIPFSIQSISKVFGFNLAFKAIGEKIWTRLGKEPSGTAFNSLVQLENENGIPRNPFINAGALVVSDIILSHYKEPKKEFLSFIKKLAGSDSVVCNENVAQSEKEFGHRNAALAHFMRSYGNIKNSVEDVLDLYFFQCAIEMTACQLSKAFLFLANHGIVPYSKQEILSMSQAKRTNALMLTTGLYNEAGDFAYRVGIPGKSGVGGGIIAIIPQNLSICVWSPGLNSSGNSLAGMEALERFTTYTGVSVF